MPDLRGDAHGIFQASLRAVSPSALLARIDFDTLLPRPITEYRRVAVVGAGKAAMAMAGALEARLAATRLDGFVVVPHGYPASFPAGERRPERIEVLTAAHPVPDAAGIHAASRAIETARALGEGDLLLVLLSGGGSALWAHPPAGVSLDDLAETTRLLLASGADIHASNAVRKHLSRIAGGQLALAAAPATLLALAVSDVVGDDPSTIGSGPTVGDDTSFGDARAAIVDHGLWEEVPSAVRRAIKRGVATETPETPAAGDARLARARTTVIGTNATALDAAAREARRRGYAVRRLAEPLSGEAQEAGARLARELMKAPAGQPLCLLAGGETTVRVTGSGTGGRNQELALAAAIALADEPREVAFLAAGTDGVDGPTDAAGACVDGSTASRARALGIDPLAHLQNNDAYPLLDAVGAVLRTGPTHTNVMDVLVALIAA